MGNAGARPAGFGAAGLAASGGRLALNWLLERNIVKSLGPLGASGTSGSASLPRGLNTFVASLRPDRFRNALSPPGTPPTSEGEKPPPREEIGDDTVPENVAGIPEGLAVDAAGGFKASDASGSESNLETPSLAPSLLLSLKI